MRSVPSAVEPTARRFGPVGGRPLVALPGLNDGLAPLWVADPPPPPPAFRGDHVVVLSFPDPLPSDPSTRTLAEIVGRWLDAQVGPCVLSGHSMGAMVALHLAADRPDLIRGLVLGAVVADADERVEAVLSRWERSLTAGRFLDFHHDAVRVAYTGVERQRRTQLLRTVPPEPPDDRLVQRHVALSRAVRRHEAGVRLADIAAPTLVLAGEHDRLTRPGRSLEVARALPRARFQRFAGVAHGFPEQAAQRYTTTLDRFVHRELDSGEAP